MAELGISSVQKRLEDVRINVEPDTNPSAFLTKLPRELRNQVYSHVLNRRAGIGGASLFRVNHRIHDELTEVILTTQIYVLLVIKASATVKKALTPSGCIQGPCVKQFKNYNMRVSITDTKHQKKKIAGSTATVMLSDMASLQDFCHRVMRDDGSGRYSKYIRPLDKVARIKEHALLTETATKFSEYKDLVLINLTDTNNAQQAISKIVGTKWTCGEDFLENARSLCKEGDFALARDQFDKAFALYTTADDVISSTLRSPQFKVLFKEDKTRVSKLLFRSMHTVSLGLAIIYVLRAKSPNFNCQENAHLTVFYAQRSVELLRRVPITDGIAWRVIHSRGYFCIAQASRYLGKLPDANEAMDHALDLLPDSAEYQAEAREIRMATKSSGVRASRRIFLS